MDSSTQANEHSDTSPALAVFEKLQALDPTMQVSTATLLLYVAQHQNREGGLTTRQLAKGLNLSPAAASRNSYYWAEGVTNMPNGGHEYLEITIDPRDRRRRIIKLTPQGQDFVQALNIGLN